MKTFQEYLLVSTVLLLSQANGQTSQISWYSINSGFSGGYTSVHTIRSVVGQSLVGLSTSSNSSLVSGFLSPESLRRIVVSIRREEDVPSYYRLHQNYPNPFNPNTTIQFSVPRRSFVSLKVYNILGQEMATLAAEEFEPGTYRTRWDTALQASGVYFYRLVAGPFVETKKLLLLK